MRYELKANGETYEAPSLPSALAGAIGWSRAIGAPVEVYGFGLLIRTVHPTDTLTSLRSKT